MNLKGERFGKNSLGGSCPTTFLRWFPTKNPLWRWFPTKNLIAMGVLLKKEHFLKFCFGAPLCYPFKYQLRRRSAMFLETSIWPWLKQKTVPKWNLGKWKHGPQPAVCPSDQIILVATRQMAIIRNPKSKVGAPVPLAHGNECCSAAGGSFFPVQEAQGKPGVQRATKRMGVHTTILCLRIVIIQIGSLPFLKKGAEPRGKPFIRAKLVACLFLGLRAS